MSQYEPKVSIIIPVRNAERTLKTTFEYMLNIDYPRSKMELLIADGGSTDKTVEIITETQTQHSFIKRIDVPDSKSPGHARNAALKEVTGEFVLFTDGDCAPEPNWIYEMVAPFKDDKAIGGVGGDVLTLRVEPDNYTESYCEQVGFLSPMGRCELTQSGYMPTIKQGLPHEVNGGDHCPFFATANFAVRKEAIDKIGGEFWDQPTGEDVDFSLRIMRAGYVLYFKREGIVKHMHRVNLKSFCKQYYGYGYGHPLLINKHAAKSGIEIFIQFGKGLYFIFPSKKKGILHIGDYHLMHTGLALTLLSLIGYGLFKWEWLVTLLGFSVTLLLLFTLRYFWPVLKLKPLYKFFTFARVRYASNKAFIKGGLKGQKSFDALCLEPSW